MKDQILTIETNQEIQKDIFQMTLTGDTGEIGRPGRFINIRLDGFYLRRPISLSDYGDGKLTIIYKVVGRGTRALSEYKKGKELDVLLPLGNGFDPDAENARDAAPVLVGGGIGLPPLYGLAKALKQQGRTPVVIAGFNTKDDVIMEEDFRSLGIEPVITTVDGSLGMQGMVTDALEKLSSEDVFPGNKAFVFACGPEPMLHALWNPCNEKSWSGQFSFEARMACGFGACMGCSCKTKYGNKRICTDGPVLTKEEIIW